MPDGGRGGRHEAAARLCLSALAAILAAAFCDGARAQERTATAAGGFEAKLEYCKTCHGLSGQGYLGYFPMPRLAGQQPEYIEAQLAGLHRAAAHQPDHVQCRACAEPVDDLGSGQPFPVISIRRPSAARRGDPSRTGKRIFEEGLPESNVPACSACHGTDGHGQNEIPRLAGQVYPYMVGQLSGWSKRARPGHRGRYFSDHGADGA